jgi:hypothetical protein
VKATSCSSAGIDKDRHGWIEPSGGAAFRGEGLARQTEDVRGEGVRDVEGPVQRDGEVSAVDHEFEAQDTEGEVCGQRPPAEHDRVS